MPKGSVSEKRLYFIRAGDNGPVKIGIADSIPERMATLQSASAVTLCLIREIPGNRAQEQWLHQRFAEVRLRGEWFTFTEEMLTVVPPALHNRAGRAITANEAPSDPYRVALEQYDAAIELVLLHQKRSRSLQEIGHIGDAWIEHCRADEVLVDAERWLNESEGARHRRSNPATRKEL